MAIHAKPWGRNPVGFGSLTARILFELRCRSRKGKAVIHLDANATTPMPECVVEVMVKWLREGNANPSGSYLAAKKARKAIETAREQVAGLIGALPDEIVFTSGGTESNNAALHSMNALTGEGRAVISAIEHSAVLRYVEACKRETTKVAVTSNGCLDLTAYEQALNGAAYVSLMSANNETGVIQPVVEAALLARSRGLPFHTDGIQSIGKTAVNVRELGVDLLSLSAHKFHGPKGVGALFVRNGLRFQPFFHGGGQEKGRRSGTENTAGIVGMGAAAEFVTNTSYEAVRHLRDEFEAQILQTISGLTINGSDTARLPNTSHVSFARCDAAGLLILLDEAGIECSAGSACMTGRQQPSHVQIAMGIPIERAKSSLRFSFSRMNSMEDARHAATALAKCVEKLRRVQGAGLGPVVIYSP